MRDRYPARKGTIRSLPCRRRGRLTTIVAAFLLVTVVLFIAHRQGQRKHATLTKPEFIARADAVCSATRQRMRSIKVPAINIGNAVSKDRDAWLAGVEKRRRVLKDELDQLGALIPPTGFHNEWTGVVSDLGSAELALTGLEHAVKQIDEKDATDILTEIQQIGARIEHDASLRAEDLPSVVFVVFGIDELVTGLGNPSEQPIAN